MLYFFKSTNNADIENCIGVSGTSAKNALWNAVDYFYRNNFKGFPVQVMMSILFALCISLNANAADNDTLNVDNSKITRVIEEKGKTSSGKDKITYYMIYNGELIKTSKTVIEKYNLAKKYGAKCPLFLVKGKSNSRIILK